MHDYNKKSIVDALHAVGLGKGDIVFTHSNVGFFGKMEGADTVGHIYSVIKDAVFEVIGPEGTWIVPVFSYSFCNKAPFDPDITPSICGFLSEGVRKDSQALRSHDANFSVAAIGRAASLLTQEAPAYSFGPGSFWDKLLAADGKICNFNFDAASTLIHYVERRLKVPYRYDKAFPGVFNYKGQTQERTFYHFVYDNAKPKHAPEFTKFDRAARQEGLAKRCNLGKGQIVLIGAHDTFELIQSKLKEDKAFLTKGM
jgi:aminoglycoside 3-N-acetyltransferase